MRRILALGLLALLLGAAGPAAAASFLERLERDELQFFPNDDPAMKAAIAKARATLPDFLAKAAHPRINQRSFALKVEVLLLDGRSEFIWVTNFANVGDDFIGLVDNEPRLVPGLKRGAFLPFRRDDIADWLYLEGDRMVGNVTLCVLLAAAPDDLRSARDHFGLDCSQLAGAPQ
ncbi:hypothetical protein IP86_19265 [Rhodopseudomonas sp. AAP120]|nr:hypothetical protein IP86_19265 [Rhodopseudomonas sp. AAP120]